MNSDYRNTYILYRQWIHTCVYVCELEIARSRDLSIS